MNKDRAKGILNVIVGKVMEGVGLMVGNRKQLFKDAGREIPENDGLSYGKSKNASNNQAKHF